MVDPRTTMAPRGADDGILDVFRRATAGRHAAIEDLLDLRRPFGRAHYTRVLQGFAAFLAAWEPRMADALPERLHAWFGDGRRLHLLHQDLAVLHIQPAPAREDTPALPTLPHALGSLYVMEGSALGGQFIAAHVRRHLGLAPEQGASYFHGCGRGTAERWREARALFASELQGDAAGSAAAVQSAQDTFDALTRTFQDVLHERAAA
ncbi:biliverdin-producing heme oxygenase [Ramlibacter algicola]|uniref:Biliverdin-producing heme oxygenase n=1 Tax=Ramlibacter algicola TaxID=2795217 RepID=A0A934UQ03_9BURK|nr:biliverdin-producing heme oxygenase [Ramlibacter algicola]MBK0391042.1 biliverdin-producing heme oxygenase [Ramlibacter algicola]